MENTLFVLGAHDPEMKKIEEILCKLGYSCSYALQGSERSNVSNAYKSSHFNFFESEIVYIECNSIHKSEVVVMIDHHHPGDYGYDLDYNDFVEASSLGQFLKYILNHDFNYVSTILNLEVFPKKEKLNKTMYYTDNWYLDTENGTVKIPEDIVLLAGIDHCLTDAYKGKCKGINPEKLFETRLKQISKDLDIDISKINDLVDLYSSKLRYFGKILDLTYLKMGEDIYSPEYLVLRELSISKNIPIAVKIEYDNLKKIMFLSLEKNEVEDILKEKKFKDIELINMFGVPNRGYAGGFIKE